MSATGHITDQMKRKADGDVPEDHHLPALILGNGPSLRNIDLRKLNGYVTFGMNAAYRYWREIDWWPDYYACLDLVVGESHKDAIANMIERADDLGIHRFLLRDELIERLGGSTSTDRIACYEQLVTDGILPALYDVTTGSHTLLWAESLGFSTILLAGVDCNYIEVVPGANREGEHLRISSTDENPNYFFRNYQQIGDRYNQPNPTPDLHINSWRNVSYELRPFTVVVNLNPESKVSAFTKNDHPKRGLDTGIAIFPESEERRHTPLAKQICRTSVESLSAKIIKLRSIPLRASPLAIVRFLEERQAGIPTSRGYGWRVTCGLNAITWSCRNSQQSPADRPETDTNSLKVAFEAKHGNLAPALESPSHRDRSSASDILVLSVTDHRRIAQLEKMIMEIYEEFGQPRLTQRLANRLEELSRQVWLLIPWKLRRRKWIRSLNRIVLRKRA